MREDQKRAFANLVDAIRTLEHVGTTTAYGEFGVACCPCCGADAPIRHSTDCALRDMRGLIQTLGEQMEHGTPSHRHAPSKDPATPLPEEVNVLIDGSQLARVMYTGSNRVRWECINCGSHQERDPWTAKEAHRAAAEHVRRCDMRTREH